MSYTFIEEPEIRTLTVIAGALFIETYAHSGSAWDVNVGVKIVSSEAMFFTFKVVPGGSAGTDVSSDKVRVHTTVAGLDVLFFKITTLPVSIHMDNFGNIACFDFR